MPWTCGACAQAVERDDLSGCPACGASKAAWTLVGSQTRSFTARRSRQRFECLLGQAGDPLPAGGSYAGSPLEPADHVPAVCVAMARAWQEQGVLPPPAQVLWVRLHPGRVKERAVTVAVLYETREARDLSHEPPADEPPAEGGAVDARFLCVYGEGAADLSFPGLLVLDVSEAEAGRPAPALTVTALRRPRQELPLRGGPAATWGTAGYRRSARAYRQRATEASQA